MADNKYPYGQLNKDDEGELKILMHVEGNTVRVDFGKPVKWFALPPDEAIGFAELLIKHAGQIKQRRQ